MYVNNPISTWKCIKKFSRWVQTQDAPFSYSSDSLVLPNVKSKKNHYFKKTFFKRNVRVHNAWTNNRRNYVFLNLCFTLVYSGGEKGQKKKIFNHTSAPTDGNFSAELYFRTSRFPAIILSCHFRKQHSVKPWHVALNACYIINKSMSVTAFVILSVLSALQNSLGTKTTLSRAVSKQETRAHTRKITGNRAQDAHSTSCLLETSNAGKYIKI